MTSPDTCAFCNPANLTGRTIREGDLFLSFVSRPWFRSGHCLVIPRRHVEAPYELTRDEGAEIMEELGRIGMALDDGFGTGITEKYAPRQAQNGVKMNHLHYHVFPRIENEKYLFPVPEPNSFDGFVMPTDNEVLAVVECIK